jgi:hypothetical protein
MSETLYLEELKELLESKSRLTKILSLDRVEKGELTIFSCKYESGVSTREFLSFTLVRDLIVELNLQKVKFLKQFLNIVNKREKFLRKQLKMK